MSFLSRLIKSSVDVAVIPDLLFVLKGVVLDWDAFRTFLVDVPIDPPGN